VPGTEDTSIGREGGAKGSGLGVVGGGGVPGGVAAASLRSLGRAVLERGTWGQERRKGGHAGTVTGSGDTVTPVSSLRHTYGFPTSDPSGREGPI